MIVAVLTHAMTYTIVPAGLLIVTDILQLGLKNYSHVLGLYPP